MKLFDVTNILVATDLSDSSVPALQCARAFADQFAAKVTVMYSDPVAYPVDIALGGPVFVRPEAEVRDQVTRYAAPVMEGRPYDIEVTAGPPIPAILRAAADLHADLVVVATHVHQVLTHTILGSVSEGVLHGSRCPVLTLADRGRPVAPPHGVTKIVCPVNFSDVARDSVRAAARIAEVFGAQLVIVHVVEPDVLADAAADEGKVRLWIDPELQDSCSYRQLVLRGGPAERVLDCVEDLGADFLVIGAQYKFFRDVTVIGTTTERLIRFASCPVLVIPRQPVALRETAPQRPQRETTVRRD